MLDSCRALSTSTFFRDEPLLVTAWPYARTASKTLAAPAVTKFMDSNGGHDRENKLRKKKS